MWGMHWIVLLIVVAYRPACSVRIAPGRPPVSGFVPYAVVAMKAAQKPSLATRIVVRFSKFDLGFRNLLYPLFFLSSVVGKHVFKYFSEVCGFGVEDQGLSFLYGGNSERL